MKYFETVKRDFDPDKLKGKRRAWTGGKAPTKSDWNSNRNLRILTRWFFHDQLHDASFQWKLSISDTLGFWPGTGCLERARIFWNRAKLDAFATLNLN